MVADSILEHWIIAEFLLIIEWSPSFLEFYTNLPGKLILGENLSINPNSHGAILGKNNICGGTWTKALLKKSFFRSVPTSICTQYNSATAFKWESWEVLHQQLQQFSWTPLELIEKSRVRLALSPMGPLWQKKWCSHVVVLPCKRKVYLLGLLGSSAMPIALWRTTVALWIHRLIRPGLRTKSIYLLCVNLDI